MKIKKKLLVVVRWPLGGIRSYMRYVYSHFGSDWKITILAADVQECTALQRDVNFIGAQLILAPSSFLGFFVSVLSTLAKNKFDIIQSQGFISAITVSFANIFFRIPHVLTVHGVLESRLLTGFMGKLRRLVTKLTICSVDVLYAVSNDILDHVQQQIPCLIDSNVRQIAIMNGIELQPFLVKRKFGEFRRLYNLDTNIFIFGFLGRFMPEKGFDKIIDALVLLENSSFSSKYLVVAVGSGDYINFYKEMAKNKNVLHRIVFLPFQQDVASVYNDLDAVVMPSKWEACPLQPMEAMVSGVPIITSDCIGLREVVRDTPAIVVSCDDVSNLAAAMNLLLQNNNKNIFLNFKNHAQKRFNVINTFFLVEKLLNDTIKK